MFLAAIIYATNNNKELNEAIYLQEEALEQQKHMQEELLEKQQKLQQEIESAKQEHAQVNEVRSNLVNLSVLGKYEQLSNYLNSHYFKEVEFQDSVQLEIQSCDIIKNYYLNNFGMTPKFEPVFMRVLGALAGSFLSLGLCL